MKRKLIVGLACILVAGLALYGCGQVAKSAATASVDGFIYAADGQTPVAGVTVWTTGSRYETSTNASGYFKLDAPPGTRDVYLEKGVFSATLSDVTFTDGQTNPVGDQDKKIYLDPDLNQPGIAVTIEKMAVVTGTWDRMQDVLAKLGYGSVESTGELVLGTEEFDLYDGNYSLPATYETFDNLINSPEAMSQYKVIFINCGNAYETLLYDSTVIDNIRNYVNAGGSLYVTDLSYDFVEQCFPEFVDFYGSDSTPASSPETMGDAEVGISGITVSAEVMDATLQTWLDGRGALNPDNTVHIEGFLSGWAVISSEAAGTKVWIRGDVDFSSYGVLGQTVRGAHSRAASSVTASAVVTEKKPLTVTFDYGSGKVLYSSYHTEDTPDPSLRPQEYILAYLIFEM